MDHERAELADIAAARATAIDTAGAMFADAGRAFWDGTEWRTHVTDTDRWTC